MFTGEKSAQTGLGTSAHTSIRRKGESRRGRRKRSTFSSLPLPLRHLRLHNKTSVNTRDSLPPFSLSLISPLQSSSPSYSHHERRGTWSARLLFTGTPDPPKAPKHRPTSGCPSRVHGPPVTRPSTDTCLPAPASC